VVLLLKKLSKKFTVPDDQFILFKAKFGFDCDICTLKDSNRVETAKSFNTQVSITKIKTLVVSKEPFRCRHTFYGNQTNKKLCHSTTYEHTEPTSGQNRTNEVNRQAEFQAHFWHNTQYE